MCKNTFRFFYLLIGLAICTTVCNTLFANEKLLSYLPGDVELIVGVNIPKFAKQNFAKSLIAEISGEKNIDNALQKFTNKTSIDPYKNLSTVLFFRSLKFDLKTGENLSGIMLHGNINSEKVMQKIKSDPDVKGSIKSEKIEGLEVVSGTFIEDGSVVSLDENTILLGNKDLINQVINVKLGKIKNVTSEQIYANLIGQINTSSDIWATFMVSPSFKESAVKAGMNKGIVNTKAVAVNINFDNDYKLEIISSLESKADVEKAKEDYKNIKDILALWAKEVPSVLQVVNNSKIEVKDTFAKMTFNINANVINDVIQLVNKTTSEKQSKSN